MEGKRGFTLIELMVVMAIIAILTVLSVGALRDLYNNYKVSQAAEEIVGLIREAQSKAMSVESGKKAFGVEIMAKASADTAMTQPVKQIDYMASGATSLEKDVVLPVTLDVTSIELDRGQIDNCNSIAGCPAAVSTKYSSAASNRSFVFNFSSPFGTPEYFLRDSSSTTDGTADYCTTAQPESYFSNPQTVTTCGWFINSNYLSNFSLFHVASSAVNVVSTAIAGTIRSDGYYSQNGGTAKIKIKYNNATRVVVVKGSGEAYIE